MREGTEQPHCTVEILAGQLGPATLLCELCLLIVNVRAVFREPALFCLMCLCICVFCEM